MKNIKKAVGFLALTSNYIAKHCSNKYGYIETDRLVIRQWIKDDCEAMTAGLSCYDTVKYLTSVPYPYTQDCAVDYLENKCKSPNTAEHISFAITLKSTGEVIGGMGANLVSPAAYNGETEGNSVLPKVYRGGIWLNQKYHGFGYGTEAYKARTKFLFDVCGAEIVESGYYCDNEKSKRMHEKIGFIETDKTEEHFCPARGQNVKCIISQITKKDFR